MNSRAKQEVSICYLTESKEERAKLAELLAEPSSSSSRAAPLRVGPDERQPVFEGEAPACGLPDACFQFRGREFFRHITCVAFLFYSICLLVLVSYLKLALVFNVD